MSVGGWRAGCARRSENVSLLGSHFRGKKWASKAKFLAKIAIIFCFFQWVGLVRPRGGGEGGAPEGIRTPGLPPEYKNF